MNEIHETCLPLDQDQKTVALPILAFREERPTPNAHHVRRLGSCSVRAVRQEIVRAVRQHRVVVLVGETGSGKTTQALFTCDDMTLA